MDLLSQPIIQVLLQRRLLLQLLQLFFLSGLFKECVGSVRAYSQGQHVLSEFRNSFGVEDPGYHLLT